MLAHHEGVRVKAYKCPAGLWTIGVGHLIGDGKSLPPEYNRTFTLKEVYDLLAKDGDKIGAVESLLKYNKAGGKVLKGLDTRRKDEAALFNKE